MVNLVVSFSVIVLVVLKHFISDFNIVESINCNPLVACFVCQIKEFSYIPYMHSFPYTSLCNFLRLFIAWLPTYMLLFLSCSPYINGKLTHSYSWITQRYTYIWHLFCSVAEILKLVEGPIHLMDTLKRMVLCYMDFVALSGAHVMVIGILLVWLWATYSK